MSMDQADFLDQLAAELASVSDRLDAVETERLEAALTPQETIPRLGDAGVPEAQAGVGAFADEPMVADGAITTTKIANGAITGVKLADATITAQKFAANLSVPQVVSSLPSLPNGSYPVGSLVFLTTDGKLYRNVADAWTTAVESDDITSLSADKITAGTLAAAILLSGYISTASSGTRVEMSNDGIRAYNGSTLIANIPTDGISDVYFKAIIQALGLTVVGDANFYGTGNTIEAGAVLTVNEGISNPASAPVLASGWNSASMTGLPNFPTYCGETNATGGAGGATHVHYFGIAGNAIAEVNASTGAYIRTLTPTINGALSGIAVLGGYIYVLDSVFGGSSVVRRYTDTDFALDATYSSVTFPVSAGRIGTLASDGTYLYIIQYDTGTTLKWRKYDSSMATVGSVVSITSSDINDPYDMKVGSFDFGADRMVLVQSGVSSAHVYDLTGTHKTDECFPVARGVLILWDGSAFWSYNTYSGSASNWTLWLNGHTGWTWAAATSDTVWVAYSWYDSNATGGTHETLVSPKASITMGRRKLLSVTTPTEPGAGGTDDPNGRRIYVAHSSTEPTSANMDLQATTADETYYLTSYSSAGAAPPGTNNFTSAGIGEVKSVGGEWSLKGDGKVVMPTPIRRVYTANDTWSPPAGLNYIEVECQGGGGAGGGTPATGSGQAAAGGGGGGGGYARAIYLASALSGSYAVTVGGGGTGASNAAGGNGSASTFAGTGITTLSGGGGSGGGVGTASSTASLASGGAGGTSSGPTDAVLVSGSDGGSGSVAGGYRTASGSGGGSVLGGGGRISATGKAYGGGGGGGATNASAGATAGANGAGGVVIVTEYYS